MESPNIKEYNYKLPEEKIALFPNKERDSAKLLVYKKGDIIHSVFNQLNTFLPADALLVFNNSKVIPARIFFKRDSGALIEVFCLNPISPSPELSQAMQQKGSAVWQCLAGNQKRWKTGEVLELNFEDLILKATLLEKLGREVNIQFDWQPAQLCFSEVLEKVGKIPLPPYIHRAANKEDSTNYQTVYAREEGAVAAPTAGLHFSENLLHLLFENGIEKLEISLHVGAGTFQPVEVEDIRKHPMHCEQIIFEKAAIEKLAHSHKKIIAVGTTSMRALESLYWFGHQLYFQNPTHFFIPKLYPYSLSENMLISASKSFQTILGWMQNKGLESIWGQTEIMIMPGYDFKVCSGLITNFHLPQSTLLMLVDAFIGKDWKNIYKEALDKDYRFLSYGDASLLLPE